MKKDQYLVLLNWCANDVLDTVRDYKGRTLSKRDAKKVAIKIAETHDPDSPVNWDVITSCIDEMIADGSITLILASDGET